MMQPAWEGVIRDFSAWMKYRNLSESTQRIYTSAAISLARFLDQDSPVTDPAAVTRRDIEAFVRSRPTQVKPANVSADFRALQQFFKWLDREEEIEKNPMTGASPQLATRWLHSDSRSATPSP